MNLDQECKAALDLPYPPVQTKSRRLDYAHAMQSNVGSGNSEMTAVSLYFYNSVILNPDYADFAQCFHRISIVEMHHLDIFATLAHQMGLDPRLWCTRNRTKCYWTPAYNSYPRRVREVVEHSIRGEEAAIKKYSRQADEICDEDIVKILERILLDERRHIEIFHAMLALLA